MLHKTRVNETIVCIGLGLLFWHLHPASALAQTVNGGAAKPPVSIIQPARKKGVPLMQFILSSPAFAQGQPIPREYTCDGADISPPLAWSGTPPDTKSLALIVDDPDAPSGTWVHWVLFNLSPREEALPEHVLVATTHPDSGTPGSNSWQRLGYGGPCPPGGTHRYFFKLYALDSLLSLPPGSGKTQLLSAMEGHVLAHTELMGTYRRR